MNIRIFDYDEIFLRRLKDNTEDYKLLEKWYQEKEIYSQFEQRILNYDEIKNKYLPRTKENAKVPVFMIEYNHKPAGIIQYQLIEKENQELYDIHINNAYELDIFIGEIGLQNKGIGKKSIELLSNYLFNEKKAKILVMCPLKDNHNAIKCYENCGFEIKKNFKMKNTIGEFHEYILMVRNYVYG